MSTPTERLRKMAIDARIQYGQETIAGGEPPYPAWADDMLEVLERLAAIEQIPPHDVERVIKASLPDGRRLGINWDAVGRAAKGEVDPRQISFNAAEVLAIYNHAPGLRPMFVPLSVYRQAKADGEQPAAIAEPDDMPPLDDRATYPASMICRLIREDRARRAAPVAQEPAGYIHPDNVRRLEAGETVAFRKEPYHYDGGGIPVFVGAALVAAQAQPSAQDREDAGIDAAFEAVRKRLCSLPRYSFMILNGGVRRQPDKAGNWLEFDQVHALFDPVAIDAARAAKGEA